jgi:dTDP-4-dehydrorhamnose 3,5-epimerase-like enzyme
MTRGGHAHWTCHEAVFPITGRFEIELDDGEVNTTVVLDDATRGIIVPAGVWCELRHFAPGTVCLVMASQEYDASGYALDRESWMKTLKLKK